ncbi:hypothetical protein [Kribbella sp. HUAS MG21]|jgi:hypothetical protein|uniref:Lipoprotein n=1 Tax=Kribbella sp. HUAS MG21 TaxID=3160966 RepID=A0AAU7TCT8_9ACTN
MPRRPAFAPAIAALSALLALTACQGSPEAGQPNTTAPSTASSSSPAPTVPSTPTTPGWTAEEQAAITAATTRYLAARRATEQALQNPAQAERTELERSGNGGQWLTDVIEDITFFRDNGWYQAGAVTLSSPTVKTVRLAGQQPEVTLTSCIDSSAVVVRYQATKKPVPLGPDNGSRHLAQARIVLAPGSDGRKAWFLISETGDAKC